MCYTNAAAASLTLNGQPVGGEPQRDKETDILYWDIDYEPGTLRCEASNGASYEIKTSKAPHALRLATDSLAHVFVEEVTLHIQGARLLGMENGNIMDSSVNGRQRANSLRVHNGRLVAYISPLQSDEIVIHASASFLQSAEIQFKRP